MEATQLIKREESKRFELDSEERIEIKSRIGKIK